MLHGVNYVNWGQFNKGRNLEVFLQANKQITLDVSVILHCMGTLQKNYESILLKI